MELKFDESTDSMVQFDCDVTCVFQCRVRHVGETHRFAVEGTASDAEVDLCVGKNLR